MKAFILTGFVTKDFTFSGYTTDPATGLMTLFFKNGDKCIVHVSRVVIYINDEEGGDNH